jgi:hypothetical protein
MGAQTKKRTSPSFVLTLPLHLQPFQVNALAKRFEVARRIHNACVREAYRRYHLMVQAKAYRKVMTAIRATYREEAKQRHLGGLGKRQRCHRRRSESGCGQRKTACTGLSD